MAHVCARDCDQLSVLCAESVFCTSALAGHVRRCLAALGCQTAPCRSSPQRLPPQQWCELLHMLQQWHSQYTGLHSGVKLMPSSSVILRISFSTSPSPLLTSVDRPLYNQACISTGGHVDSAVCWSCECGVVSVAYDPSFES